MGNAMKNNGSGFLRIIIVYKAVIGAIELGFSAVLLKSLDIAPELTMANVASNLNIDIGGRLMQMAAEKAASFDGYVFGLIAVAALAIGALNVIEAWGLHQRERWAEWLTVAATAVFIPYELYITISSFSVFKFMILFANSYVVYYLARHKELFRRRVEIEAPGA